MSIALVVEQLCGQRILMISGQLEQEKTTISPHQGTKDTTIQMIPDINHSFRLTSVTRCTEVKPFYRIHDYKYEIRGTLLSMFSNSKNRTAEKD
jgi:hypothetical protein